MVRVYASIKPQRETYADLVERPTECYEVTTITTTVGASKSDVYLLSPLTSEKKNRESLCLQCVKRLRHSRTSGSQSDR